MFSACAGNILPTKVHENFLQNVLVALQFSWLFAFVSYKRISQYKFELYTVFIVNTCRKNFIHEYQYRKFTYKFNIMLFFFFAEKARNKFTEKTPYVALVQEVSSENLELLVKCRNIYFCTSTSKYRCTQPLVLIKVLHYCRQRKPQ